MDAVPSHLIHEEVEVPVSVDKVWATVGKFDGLEQWGPGVVECSCSLMGDIRRRTLVTEAGGVITEEEMMRDDAAHLYQYTIVSGGLPGVTDVKCTLKADVAGDKMTKVIFEMEFLPSSKDWSEDAVRGVYEPIMMRSLRNLDTYLKAICTVE